MLPVSKPPPKSLSNSSEEVDSLTRDLAASSYKVPFFNPRSNCALASRINRLAVFSAIPEIPVNCDLVARAIVSLVPKPASSNRVLVVGPTPATVSRKVFSLTALDFFFVLLFSSLVSGSRIASFSWIFCALAIEIPPNY